MESNPRRETTCKICDKVFQLATRGPLAEWCLDCRKEARRERYGARYIGRYYTPHPKPRKMGYRELALSVKDQKCERCGINSKRLVVHHKDGNGRNSEIPNHKIDNLIVVCNKCHMELHGIRDALKMKNIKRLRKTMTFQEIASIYGVSRQRKHHKYSSL